MVAATLPSSATKHCINSPTNTKREPAKAQAQYLAPPKKDSTYFLIFSDKAKKNCKYCPKTKQANPKLPWMKVPKKKRKNYTGE